MNGRRYIRAINTRDLARLSASMTSDHRFVDSIGKELRGRNRVISAWRAYFAFVTDYRISVRASVRAGSRSLLVGRAQGRIAGVEWETPAAWELCERDGRISVWRVFADNQAMRTIFLRARRAPTRMIHPPRSKVRKLS